jgi:hypothetical protein
MKISELKTAIENLPGDMDVLIGVWSPTWGRTSYSRAYYDTAPAHKDTGGFFMDISENRQPNTSVFVMSSVPK